MSRTTLKVCGWGAIVRKSSEPTADVALEKYKTFLLDKYNSNDFHTSIDAIIATIDDGNTQHSNFKNYLSDVVQDIAISNDLNLRVILPVSCIDDWVRYGDPLDRLAFEANVKNGDTSPQITWLQENPYPFNGKYMLPSGRPTSDIDTLLSIVRERESSWKKQEAIIRNASNPQKLARFLEDNDYGDLYNLLSSVVPIVPQEIKDICEWGNVSVNPQALRPVLVTSVRE